MKGRDADRYSEDVLAAFSGVVLPSEWPQPQRWKKAHVTYTWCYAGVAPDHGNLGGNVKYLQDILCFAPRKAAVNRWYMGICENDSGITAEYVLEDVKHRDAQCVIVQIVRIDD